MEHFKHNHLTNSMISNTTPPLAAGILREIPVSGMVVQLGPIEAQGLAEGPPDGPRGSWETPHRDPMRFGTRWAPFQKEDKWTF